MFCIFGWASHARQSLAQASHEGAHSYFSSAIAFFLNFLKKLSCVGTSLLEALTQVVIIPIKQVGLSWTKFRLGRIFQTKIPANRVAGKVELSGNRMEAVSLLVHGFYLIDEVLLALSFLLGSGWVWE